MRKFASILLLAMAVIGAPARAQTEASTKPTRTILDPQALSGVGVIAVSDALRRDATQHFLQSVTKPASAPAQAEFASPRPNRQAAEQDSLLRRSVGDTARVDSASAKEIRGAAPPHSLPGSEITAKPIRAAMLEIPNPTQPAKIGNRFASVAGPAHSSDDERAHTSGNENANAASLRPARSPAPVSSETPIAALRAERANPAPPRTTPLSGGEMISPRGSAPARLASEHAFLKTPNLGADTSIKSNKTQRGAPRAKVVAAVNRGRIVWGGGVH